MKIFDNLAPLVVTSESHTTNIAKTEPGATNLNQKNSQQVWALN